MHSLSPHYVGPQPLVGPPSKEYLLWFDGKVAKLGRGVKGVKTDAGVTLSSPHFDYVWNVPKKGSLQTPEHYFNTVQLVTWLLDHPGTEYDLSKPLSVWPTE